MADNLTVYQGALGDSRPSDVAISVDGTKIYAAGSDGNLSVYSAATGELLNTWAVGTQLGGMDISPDGSFAVVVELTPLEEHYADTGWPDNQFTITAYKVDLATGEITSYPTVVTGYEYVFHDVAIMADGTVLLTEEILPGWSGWVSMKSLDLTTGLYTDASQTIRHNSILSDSTDGSSALIAEYNTSDAPLEIYQSGAGIVANHGGYADGVMGFNWGVQAYSTAAGLAVQSMGTVLNIYDGQLNYQFDLGQLHPDLSAGGVAGLAFDASGQYLFILNDADDAIYQVSISDWSIVGEFAVGADVDSVGGDFGNRLLVAPDGSYFTVVTENGLIMVDPTAPPPATEDADTMLGTPGDDVLDGLGGNDIIKGLAGNDTLDGSGGNDTLAGDSGADTLNGGDGNDILYSGNVSPSYNPWYGLVPVLDHGTEVDSLNGGAGDDVIYAGYGDDVDGGDQEYYGDQLLISFQGAGAGIIADFNLATNVIGGATITGIEHYVYVEGSEFDDYIAMPTDAASGYAPSASLFGLGGNDVLIGGADTEVIDGGDGNDIVDASASIYFGTLYGGNGDDIIQASLTAGSVAYGGDGDDTIYAIGAARGGDGNDTIIIQESRTTYLGTGGAPIDGGDGDDHITGADGADVIAGGAGADVIDGGAGDDRLFSGNSGNGWDYDPAPLDSGNEHDVLVGGDGDDGLSVGYGDDADGGDGTDTLRLNLQGASEGITLDSTELAAGQAVTIGGGTIQNFESIDYLIGSNFDDNLTIVAQANPITIDGANGDDWITVGGDYVSVNGGDGNDEIDILSGQANVYGGDGFDAIYVQGGTAYADGGNGDDFFFSGAGADTFFGGDGNDWVNYHWFSAGVTVNLSTGVAPGGDQLYSIENVDGSNYADMLTGDYQSNYLSGRTGNDTLEGLDGNDILFGGAGNDTMKGGTGDDLYFVDSTRDVVTELAGQGIDQVFTMISYKLGANVENGVLDGNAAINLTGNSLNNDLRGNESANTLNGGGGNDFLDGMAGSDTLIGGAGDDTYVVDNAGDKVSESSRGGSDEVLALTSYTLAARVEVEKMTVIGDGAINLTGNDLAQTLQGNDFSNSLNGAGGVDTLVGGGGADILNGGRGNDVLWGGDGADDFAFLGTGRTVGNDRIMDFQSGIDKIDLHAFGITITQVKATTVGSDTILSIDSNHDGHADFTITLAGAGVPDAGDYIF